MPAESLKEFCGVFGIHGHPEAANLAYLGMYALQHRGQEAAGIASAHEGRLHLYRRVGLVADVFRRPEVFELVPGDIAIGHVRYSTYGASELKNAAPVKARYAGGEVAIAHNGNLTNAPGLRRDLEARGAIFSTTTDSEVILHLLAQSRAEGLVNRTIDALQQVEGAYSLLMVSDDRQLLAVRDPHGFRPLVMGELGGRPVFASETCALDLIRAKFIRDVEPGEVVHVDASGEVSSRKPFTEVVPRPCVFEHIYFARPDSTIFGSSVYRSRKALGERLYEEQPVEADVVVPVPDSGVPAAMGFAHASGIPYELGLVRNHYVGRTFIEPAQSIRHFGVRVKLNPVPEVLQGKRVVLVDDSIVRGTTSKKIIKMVRDAGAAEVHMRISAPPTAHPCFYGIDTPTRAELIGAQKSLDEIRAFVGADSIGYLSVEGMLEAVHRGEDGTIRKGTAGSSPSSTFCTACFTGDYPVNPHPQGDA